MLIHCNITSVAGSIRFNCPVRALLCAIIRRFPWILSTFISVLMCICTCCIQKMISVFLKILCSLREHPCKEWKHKQFCIPESMSAIFFSCQKLGADIYMIIMLISGTHQMEDIKANCLIELFIASDLNISVFPHFTVNIFVKLQFLIKSCFHKLFYFFFYCSMKRISRTFSLGIHRNIFYDLDFFSFFYMDIAKLNILFTKSAGHTVSKNLFSISISFDTASTSYMQMILSCCNFYISAIFSQFLICCHVSMFYFKTRCIIEIDNAAINNTFYLNDSTVIDRCHIKFNTHTMHIISAYKSNTFNKSFSSF